jgi:rare lipoprotein A
MIKRFFASRTYLIVLIVMFTSCSRYVTETGTASYYGGQFNHKKTSSGKKFNKHRLTAAHKTLPFGTKVIVTNLSNHQRVKVRITDRGPFVKGRIIDLSEKAARRISMISQGITQVELKYKKKK